MAPNASDDTIFALSSAHGRAGIAVVRVSGLKAGEAIEALTGREPPEARRASLRNLFLPPLAGGEADEVGRGGAVASTSPLPAPRADLPPPALLRSFGGLALQPAEALAKAGRLRGRKDVIDQSLVLFFSAPASATGEDVAEFHVHGGRAVIEAVLQALASIPGLHPAEPGEFTRRAVEHGKLDLTSAEGLADLIDAETDAQRLQALRQYDGALASLYDGWRQRLIRICAWAEAEIDFSDEEIDSDLELRVRAGASEILEEIQRHLADARQGEITREGLHLTVIGKPNAGKSSLVNALARRDVAIVSPTPGTTRDVLETKLDLGGYAVILADTAGLRTAAEDVEAEGVRRALARAEQADLVLLLLDGTDENPFEGFSLSPILLGGEGQGEGAVDVERVCDGYLQNVPDGRRDRPDSASQLGRPLTPPSPPSKMGEREKFVLPVWNKADLPWPSPREGLKISARTGDGLDALVERLVELVSDRLERPRESPPITRARHRRSLQAAADALARATTAGPGQLELLAEDLRLALRSIGRITGRVDVEELLDVVFRDFCIGK